MKIQLFDPICLPRRAHPTDSGMDCVARMNVVLQPFQPKLVPLGFCLELDPGQEAQIRPRSGMAKNGLLVHFGTVDYEYRGEVQAIVTLIGSEHPVFFVERGMRIAQMVFAKVEFPEVHIVDSLAETERGSSGFGSTGQ